jgi:hypothetical protein
MISLLLVSIFSASLFAQQATPSATTSAANDGWQLVKDENGAKIYIHDVPNGNSREAKMIIELNAPLADVEAYFNDFSTFKNWITVYDDAYMLKRIDENEFYGYATYKTAMTGGQKMDIVIHQTTTNVGDNRVGTFTAAPAFIPTKEDYIRIQYFQTTWALRKISDKKCLFTYRMKLEREATGSEPLTDFTEGNYQDIMNLQRIFANGSPVAPKASGKR